MAPAPSALPATTADPAPSARMLGDVTHTFDDHCDLLTDFITGGTEFDPLTAEVLACVELLCHALMDAYSGGIDDEVLYMAWPVAEFANLYRIAAVHDHARLVHQVRLVANHNPDVPLDEVVAGVMQADALRSKDGIYRSGGSVGTALRDAVQYARPDMSRRVVACYREHAGTQVRLSPAPVPRANRAVGTALKLPAAGYTLTEFERDIFTPGEDLHFDAGIAGHVNSRGGYIFDFDAAAFVRPDEYPDPMLVEGVARDIVSNALGIDFSDAVVNMELFGDIDMSGHDRAIYDPTIDRHIDDVLATQTGVETLLYRVRDITAPARDAWTDALGWR